MQPFGKISGGAPFLMHVLDPSKGMKGLCTGVLAAAGNSSQDQAYSFRPPHGLAPCIRDTMTCAYIILRSSSDVCTLFRCIFILRFAFLDSNHLGTEIEKSPEQS